MVRLLLALCLLGCAAPSTQRIGSATATTYPQLDSLLRAGVSTITLRGTIDASGRPPLSVTQDGVTIKGGRIVSGSFYSGGESMNAALIVTASDVTISGVTFVGPTDNPYTQRFTKDSSWCAIRSDGYRLRVVGCQFYNAHKWALWLRRCGGSLVDSCTFIGARGAGYGYGIWAGSISDTTTATISRCIFDRCRVFIDGGGHVCSFRVVGCSFGTGAGYVSLQRHDRSTSRYFGGDSLTVMGCDFHSAEDVIRHPYPATPKGVTAITANRFAGQGCEEVPARSIWCGNDTGRVVYAGNTYGYKWDAPVITASADTVKAGQGVSVRVAGYNTALWTIAGRCTLVTGSFRITLPVGVYDIKAQGVGPGNRLTGISTRRLVVTSPVRSVVFAYRHTVPGRWSPYELQVRVGDSLLWQSPLVSGGAWQRVTVPCSVTGRLAFRLAAVSSCANTDSTEVALYLDDAYIIPGSPDRVMSYLPGFEADRAYPGWNQTLVGAWSSGIVYGDSYSGSRCWQFSNRAGMVAKAGEWAEVWTWVR